MIRKRTAAFGLTLALAAGCAPNAGPDEIEPTGPQITASAAPGPTASPPAVEVRDCPNLLGSYYISMSATPVDRLCATAAGIKGLIDSGEDLTVEEAELAMPVMPAGSCVLNSIVHKDGETTYFAFARPSQRPDVAGAEVTAFVPELVIGSAPTHEVVFSPAQDGKGYEALLPGYSVPVPVASLGNC